MPLVLFLTVNRFDPSLEKAILFAVGNTLVCDDLTEAKHLSWSGERFKGKFYAVNKQQKALPSFPSSGCFGLK